MGAVKDLPADSGDADGVISDWPVEEYGELTVTRLLPRLSSLSDAQLRRLRDYERRHANRTPVIDALDRMLA